MQISHFSFSFISEEAKIIESKTAGISVTVKFLKIRTHAKFAVIILKFEQCGFTIEECV